MSYAKCYIQNNTNTLNQESTSLFKAVFGIRIRNGIRMFLGLPDPDPFFVTSVQSLKKGVGFGVA
jgi:hypothetical protein